MQVKVKRPTCRVVCLLRDPPRIGREMRGLGGVVVEMFIGTGRDQDRGQRPKYNFFLVDLILSLKLELSFKKLLGL